MIDRRRLLMSASAVAAFGGAAGCASTPEAGAVGTTPAQAGSGDAALNTLMDKVFNEQILSSPEFLTSLGINKGPNAEAKSRLNDRAGGGHRPAS